MSDNGASYGALETAWGQSSGGHIPDVPLPSYQSKIAGHNGASTNRRNAPDVSAQAADANIFYDGGQTRVDGTSEATPLWAGFMALVNETASKGGNSAPGFVNPALYEIASTSKYDANFHDVVTGCTPNGLQGAESASYCAGSGYDLATGLGSPRHALIYALSGVSAYPLFCQGPLVTEDGNTTFKWASVGAGTQKPGPGECAWADRSPSGTEIKTGDKNTIDGDLGALDSPAAGKFIEVGVFNNGTELILTQTVGFVSPPFSSSASLP